MLTAAALLELDFEQPSLDYHQLMKLTKILTNGKAEDIENMFRRMCFNVFAHNRDDHSKNFTYIYREEEEQWRLGPAYDLTYSNTYYGEHTTSVDGNGRNPGEKELLAVGLAAGMKKTRCMEMIKQIRTCVQDMLGHYLFRRESNMEALIWETADELDQKLASRLRNIRKRRAISQQRLADMSGVSYGSIKRFEATGQISLLSLTKIT